MKNSDFIKAKAEFIYAMDVGGGVSYILLADNQDAESGIAWFLIHVQAT